MDLDPNLIRTVFSNFVDLDPVPYSEYGSKQLKWTEKGLAENFFLELLFSLSLKKMFFKE